MAKKSEFFKPKPNKTNLKSPKDQSCSHNHSLNVPEEKKEVCLKCGYSLGRYIISEIKESPEGFSLKGSSICISRDCDSFFELTRNIPVELKELKCPSCDKNNLVLAFKKITKTNEGFAFSALLKCSNSKCSWKKAVKTGLHSTQEMLSSIKKAKISTTGIELEK